MRREKIITVDGIRVRVFKTRINGWVNYGYQVRVRGGSWIGESVSRKEVSQKLRSMVKGIIQWELRKAVELIEAERGFKQVGS